MNQNIRRTEQAREALKAYEALPGVDKDASITDLIADLLHEAARRGEEPLTLAARATRHYLEEIGD